ncbi:Vacuolar protein sorting 15 [Carabus blaptoides fortunei]
MSLRERSYIQYQIADCRNELRSLIIQQQEHYTEALRGREWSDGTRRNITNRSKQVYRTSNGVGLAGLTMCDGGQSLAATTMDDANMVLRVDSGTYNFTDLRFQLLIATIVHPTGARERKVISHTTAHSWVVSRAIMRSPCGTWRPGSDSVCPLSPLSNTQVANNAVCAMYAGCIDRSEFLLTGGTDQKIQFWDLDSPSSSYLAIPAPSDTNTSALRYESRLIDGTSVVSERSELPRDSSAADNSSDEIPRAGPEPSSRGHRDWISDVTLCKASQCFLLTGSRNGVIKVWK